MRNKTFRPIRLLNAPGPMRHPVLVGVSLGALLVASLVLLTTTTIRHARLREEQNRIMSTLDVFADDAASSADRLAVARRYFQTSAFPVLMASYPDGRFLYRKVFATMAAAGTIAAPVIGDQIARQLWDLYRWLGPRVDRQAEVNNAALASFIVLAMGVLTLALFHQIRLRYLERDRRRIHALARNHLNTLELGQQSVMMELHDSVGQQLAAAQLMLSSVQGAGRLSHEDDHTIEECAAVLTEARETVRRIARKLHPAELDQIGLAGAITQLADEYRPHTAARITVTVPRDADDAVRRDARIQVYRIVQEALTNAVMHAKAITISMDLELSGDTLWAVVRDDGVGFRQEGSQSPGGFGILSMSERAHILDGTLAVLSRPGVGTTVSLQVPARRGREDGAHDSHTPGGRSSAVPDRREQGA